MDITTSQGESAERLAITNTTQVVWPRFLAWIGDTIVISVLIGIVQNVYGTRPAYYGTPGYSFQSVNSSSWLPIHWGNINIDLTISLWITVPVLYFTLQEAFFGATLGKVLCRLHVVGVDGQRLTVRAALLRNLLRPIDYFFLNWRPSDTVFVLASAHRRPRGAHAGRRQ